MADIFTINLKDKIWRYFGRYADESDSFKDAEQKGIRQRFQENCAQEFDDQVNPKMVSVFEDTLNPATTELGFLSYMLAESKLFFVELAEESIQRKLIQYNTSIVALKGTMKGFEIMFNIFGISNYTIEEIFPSYTFDDPVATFDDPIRMLDSKCSCPKLRINIDTDGLDSAQLENISRFTPSIIDYLLPVTIELEQAVYYHIELLTTLNGAVALTFVGVGNVVIDWGDGSIETFDMALGTVNHIYSNTSNNTVLITFEDVDSFSSMTWEDNEIISLYVADALINNDTDFQLNLKGNLLTDANVKAIMQSLLQRSDQLQTNDVLIDLRDNEVASPIAQDIKSLKFDLRDNHSIEVLIGGGFTIGFSEGFNSI